MYIKRHIMILIGGRGCLVGCCVIYDMVYIQVFLGLDNRTKGTSKGLVKQRRNMININVFKSPALNNHGRAVPTFKVFNLVKHNNCFVLEIYLFKRLFEFKINRKKATKDIIKDREEWGNGQALLHYAHLNEDDFFELTHRHKYDADLLEIVDKMVKDKTITQNYYV